MITTYTLQSAKTSDPKEEGKSQSTMPSLLIIGATILCGWLFIRSMLKRRLKRGSSYEDELNSFEKSHQAKDSLENIMVKIQEVSKECVAKIDNKIRILNQLIIETDLKHKNKDFLDEKIRILQQLISEADDRINKLSALRNELEHISARANHDSSFAVSNPIHQKVFNYADKGLSAHDISQQTGLEKGEVELILSLRNIKQK